MPQLSDFVEKKKNENLFRSTIQNKVHKCSQKTILDLFIALMAKDRNYMFRP